eukprot:scaffold1304_cov82-Cylindrotheca_fusiformis.AAC.2
MLRITTATLRHLLAVVVIVVIHNSSSSSQRGCDAFVLNPSHHHHRHHPILSTTTTTTTLTTTSWNPSFIVGSKKQNRPLGRDGVDSSTTSTTRTTLHSSSSEEQDQQPQPNGSDGNDVVERKKTKKTKWEKIFWWVGPILVYFKETQTPRNKWDAGPGRIANSDEAIMNKGAVPGQVHFFPALCNCQQLKSIWEQKGCAKIE